MKPGALWERTVTLWFRERGWPQARRLFAQGANDCGDIDGVDDWLIQAKNTGVMELGRTCAAAMVQARRAGKARWACIWKRRNHGVAQAYVVMELSTFTELIGGRDGVDVEALRGGPDGAGLGAAGSGPDGPGARGGVSLPAGPAAGGAAGGVVR